MAEGDKDVEMKDVSDDQTEESKDQAPPKKDKDILTIEGIFAWPFGSKSVNKYRAVAVT